MVVASLALMVALGGTSYAVATVTGRDVRNSSLTGADVKNSSLTGRDIRNGSVTSSDLSSGLLGGSSGADGADGADGEDGESGANGADGPSGAAGSNGNDGPTGASGPPGQQGAAGPTGATGAAGPRGDTGATGAGASRFVLINAAGEIERQSGGFTVRVAYPGDASSGANGNVYIDASTNLSNAGITATIALQNQTDQNGDGVRNGAAAGPDNNPEFSGEISVTQCALPTVMCAPPNTDNNTTFVVSPRNSDGTRTSPGSRKRFYVIVTG